MEENSSKAAGRMNADAAGDVFGRLMEKGLLGTADREKFMNKVSDRKEGESFFGRLYSEGYVSEDERDAYLADLYLPPEERAKPDSGYAEGLFENWVGKGWFVDEDKERFMRNMSTQEDSKAFLGRMRENGFLSEEMEDMVMERLYPGLHGIVPYRDLRPEEEFESPFSMDKLPGLIEAREEQEEEEKAARPSMLSYAGLTGKGDWRDSEGFRQAVDREISRREEAGLSNGWLLPGQRQSLRNAAEGMRQLNRLDAGDDMVSRERRIARTQSEAADSSAAYDAMEERYKGLKAMYDSFDSDAYYKSRTGQENPLSAYYSDEHKGYLSQGEAGRGKLKAELEKTGRQLEDARNELKSVMAENLKDRSYNLKTMLVAADHIRQGETEWNASNAAYRYDEDVAPFYGQLGKDAQWESLSEEMTPEAYRFIMDNKDVLVDAVKNLDESYERLMRDEDASAFRRFVQGMQDSFDMESLLTLGISDIAEAVKARNIAKRVAEGNGSDADRAYMEAFSDKMEAAGLYDGGTAYAVGQGFYESVIFMLDMAITGGLAAGLRKGATKGAVKLIGRKTAQEAARESTRLGKAAGTAADWMVGSALSPQTWLGMEERQMQNYMYGRDGNGDFVAYVVTDPESPFRSFTNAWGSNLISRFVERGVGPILSKGSSKVFSFMGKSTQRWTSSYLNHIRRMAPEMIGRLEDAISLQGLGSESLEEIIEQPLQYWLVEMTAREKEMGAEKAWSDVYGDGFFLETFLTCATIQAVFGTPGVVAGTAAMIDNHAMMRKYLSRLDEATVKKLRGVMALEDDNARAQGLAGLLRDAGTDQQRMDILGYAVSRAASNMGLSWQRAEAQGQETEAYRQTLMAASSDGTTVTTAQDKDGNTFAVRAVDGDSYALAYPVSDNGDGTVSLGAPVQRSMSDFDKGSMASAPLETYLQGLSARQRAQGQAEDAAAREQDMAASLPPIRADRPMQAVRPVTYFTTDMKKEKAAVEGSRIEAVADVPEGTAADAPVRVVVTAPNGKAEPGVMTYGQLQGMLADGTAMESEPVRRDPEYRVSVSGAAQEQQPLQNPQPSPQSAGVPGSQAEQNKQAEYKDTVGGSPVALSYLLEGGKGNIGSSGYFLHGLSAAFPALTEKIESIRNKYLSEINPSPMEYAASGHPSIEEIRDLIRSVYGEEGVGIYEELLRNADGFIPSEGIELGRRIESLSPLVPAQPGEVAQGGEAAVPAAQAVQATAQPSENRGGLIGRSLTEAEAEALISSMEANAETAPEVELNAESWSNSFDENNSIETPVGRVKMGDNQITKFFSKGREKEFGMVAPTLANPDVILEKEAPSQNAERGTKYLFIKTFIKPDGSRFVHFESVTVKKDGMEISISSHEADGKVIKKEMQNGVILHLNGKLSPDSERYLTGTPAKEGSDLVPTSDISETKGSADSGEKQSLGGKIAAAEEETNANPTEGQKQAGNYKKGHVRIGQFDISIENPKGSVRRGVDANGKAWEHTMQNSYGYIRGTEGVDGDHIDVFLSDKIDDWNGSRAFVIDQYNEDGTFDEHKVMLGFNEQEDAWNAYLVNYEDGWADGRRLVITPVNIEKFENWIASSHRKTKPFAEYNGVNKVQIPLDEEGSPMYEQAPVQATWDDLMARNGRDEGKVRYFAQEMKAAKDRELKAERKKKPKGKNAAELQRAMDEQQSKIGRLEQESSYWDTVLSMSYRAGEAAATEGARARQAEAGRKREASERGFPAIQARWKSARKEEGMTPEGRKARLEERHRQRQEAETEARERLAGLGAQDNGEPDYHRSGERGAEAPTEAEAELRDAIVGRLRASGIEVVTDSEAGQRVLDEVNGKNVMLNARKKKSLETDSVPQEEHQRTVISSDDGAKVLNNLDDLIKEYENSVHTKEKTFIGNAAKALGAKRYGSKSEYATFETVNGNEVTIRLSDHNASVERMDKAGRDNAISIVVTPKPNSGILDDGNAHIVEFYYNAIRLRRAEGKPLVEILKSIKQALYSGEFKDTTGLAEVKVVNADRIRYHRGYHGSGADFEAFDHVRFFRTPGGEAYGFTVGGKIYLDPRIAKADTPIHEYAHLWASALREGKPEEWRNIVGLMKDSPVWEEVKERYPELGTEDEIADEVLATYSGRRGAERLREAMRGAGKEDGLGGRLAAMEAVGRVREALQRFWHAVADFLHIRYTTAEEVADRVMRDLLEGVNPNREASEARLTKAASGFAQRHGLNEADVKSYADNMRRGNLNGAARAFNEIRRKVRLDNAGTSLGAFAKLFKPLQDALYREFGDMDKLRDRYVQAKLEERSMVEASRRRAEEQAEAERKRKEVFRGMSDEQLDEEYAKAVESDDESRMRDLVDEAARRNGYGDVSSEYQGVGAWAAPSDPGYGSAEERRASLEEDGPDVNVQDLAEGYSKQPTDYFTNLRAYGNDTPHGRESAAAINQAMEEARKGGDPAVKVYRAVPKTVKEGKVRNGDWVTPSRKYAEMHGENRLEGEYRIIEQEVPASQLWWDGNDINEWGFDDGRKYAYRNTRNNRKLNDLVTRDDRGNVIPVSQRFNPRKADVRFQFIGEKGAANLDRAEEATTRLDNLAVAREMESAGKGAKAIKLATGWERGADGKWRYEIPDLAFMEKPVVVDFDGYSLTNLGGLIKAEELFKAYPELDDMMVQYQELPLGILSHYSPKSRLFPAMITLSEVFKERKENPEWRNRVKEMDREPVIRAWSEAMDREPFDEEAYERAEAEFKASPLWKEYNDLLMGEGPVPKYIPGFSGEDVLAHEIQHAIQDMEGFAQGGDARRADYNRLSGEVEARNVARRMGMTPEERRGTLASETEDVSREDQVFLQKAFSGEPEHLFRSTGESGSATDMESKRAAVEALGRKLNVEVVFEDEASLRKQPRQYRTASGWFDRAQWRKDGRRVIHVNLSNTGDAHEAEMTVLHEAVGHMGLRELLGAENYDPFLDMVHGIIPEAQAGRLRVLVFKGHPDLARRVGEGNADGKDRETAEAELRRVMADEWLAELAEVGGEPGVWEQIVESFRMLLRRLGFELSLSESDIRALLFESRRNLESSRLPGEAERIREQQEEFREAARLDRIMEADMADMEADAGSEASSFRQWYGGNSGYVGYSMSRRAAEAREEGRFPKTDFKKEYHVSEHALKALVRTGFIDGSEWHHTSKYGNRTPFYGWTDEASAQTYLDNKKEVDALSKEYDGLGMASPDDNAGLFLEERMSSMRKERGYGMDFLTDGEKAERSRRLDEIGIADFGMDEAERARINAASEAVIDEYRELSGRRIREMESEIQGMDEYKNRVEEEGRKEARRKEIEGRLEEIFGQQETGPEGVLFRQGGGASARPTRSQRRQAERMFRDDKIISAGKEREWTSRQRFRHGMANLQEFFNDSVRLRYLGNHIRRMGGRVSSATDLYELATTVPAKEQYRSERFELSCGRPLVSCVREILQRTGKKVRDLELYMIAKHGPERNRWMYNRKKLGELADDMAYEVRNESGITRPLGEAAKNRIIASIMKEDGGKDSYMDAAVARKMAADIYEALSRSHAASMTQEAMKAQGKGLSLPKDNARILTQEDLDGIAEKTQSSLLERAEKDTDTDKDFSGLSDFAKTTGTNPENYVARFEEEVESAVPGGIDSFWEHLNAVTDFTLKTRLECGLMSEEAYQAVKDMGWSHYVPLRSWEEREEESPAYLDMEYPEMMDSEKTRKLYPKKAKGRHSLSAGPMGYIFQAAETAMKEGEKNLYLQAVGRLARENSGFTHLWTVSNAESAEAQRAEAMTLEEIHKTETGREAESHRVLYRVNGEYRYVDFVNPRMAAAVRGDRAMKWDRIWAGKLLKPLRNMTRLMSMLNTSLSSAFAIRNSIRDLQFAINSRIIEDGKRPVASGFILIWNWMMSLPAAFRSTNDEWVMTSGSKQAELVRLWKENGGETGWHTLKPLNELKRKIVRDMERGELAQRAKDKIEALPRMLQYTAEVLENSVRLAAFKDAMQRGKDAQEAAFYSKEVTTNFNRRSRMANVGGPVYMFLNASIQGLVRYAELFRKAPKAFLGFNAFMFLLGDMVSSMAAAGDDDDGEREYLKMSRYLRYTNWVVGHWTIPLAHGFKLPYGLGAAWREFQLGNMNEGELAVEVMHLFGNELLPGPLNLTTAINYDPSSMEMNLKEGGDYFIDLAPSPLVWYAEVQTNRDFMGNPIKRELYTKDQRDDVAEVARYMPNTNPMLLHFYEKIAGIGGYVPELDQKFTINKRLNGNISWWLDWNPNSQEHMISSLFGSAGRGFMDITRLAWKIYNGEAITARDIPVLNKLYRSTDPEKAILMEYYRLHDYCEFYLKATSKSSKDVALPLISDESRNVALKRMEGLLSDEQYAVVLTFDEYRKKVDELLAMETQLRGYKQDSGALKEVRLEVQALAGKLKLDLFKARDPERYQRMIDYNSIRDNDLRGFAAYMEMLKQQRKRRKVKVED